jgi:hypothetical protein
MGGLTGNSNGAATARLKYRNIVNMACEDDASRKEVLT